MKHWRDLPDFAPDNATRVRDNEAITDLRAWCIREPDSKPQYTVVRLTTGNDSGITALWKVGALADVAGIRMAPHACEGPIGGIASIHVDAAMRMVNGRYPLPDTPGLGFELNEAALKRYPFKGTVPFPPAFEADGSLASQ